MFVINRNTMRQHTHKNVRYKTSKSDQHCTMLQKDRRTQHSELHCSFVSRPLHDCRYHSKPLDHEMDGNTGHTIGIVQLAIGENEKSGRQVQY